MPLGTAARAYTLAVCEASCGQLGEPVGHDWNTHQNL